MASIPVFSVSELSFLIKECIEKTFHYVKIVGEVSNFTSHSSGHLYFSLKDSESLIKAICFKGEASKLPFKLEDGLKITVSGRIGVYHKSSNYQIIVEEVEKVEEGHLAKLFADLKNKLLKEGLFDEKYKQSLPYIPTTIGLITAPTGAVLHDIQTTLKARMPTKILLYKSIMQGSNAAPSVISGIDYFENNQNVDAIIIARGGGSFEDLFEFNNEALVRRVFACKIPVISAIGHETDFTLLDFVADVRAQTPTASAIIALPSRQEVLSVIHKNQLQIMQISKNILQTKLYDMQKVLIQFMAIKTLLNARLNNLERQLSYIIDIAVKMLNAKSLMLDAMQNEVESFNYKNIIDKGFALITKPNGTKITSIKQVAPCEEVKILLQDGEINATTNLF